MSDQGFRDTRPIQFDVYPDATAQNPDDARRVQQLVSGQPRIPLRAQPTWADGIARKTDSALEDRRAVSGGRRSASGSRDPNGDPLRAACGRGDLERPNFNLDVAENGYAWWYIDGIADDALDGVPRSIPILGLIGSVFSPWYRWSGRKKPEDHLCLSVSTYAPCGRLTMTDRGHSATRHTAKTIVVGPSLLLMPHWKLVNVIRS